MRNTLRNILTGLLLIGSTLAFAVVPPDEMVKDTSQRMLDVIKSEHEAIRQDPSRLYPLVKEIVIPHFDFDRISSWVLGKNWRTASEDQRQEFTKQFQNLLIRTYAKAMGQYSGQEINYLPVQAAKGATDVTVKTEVIQNGRPPVPVDYSLYLKDGDWKVYDVSILNTSLVTNYRSTFSTQIKRDGLDGLITKLTDRNRQAGIGSSN